MKYLLWSGILIAGVTIGFFIGHEFGEDEVNVTMPEKNSTEFVTEYIRDTVVQKERVEVPVLNDSIVLNDTIPDSTLIITDTLNLAVLTDSTDEIGDLNIRREKKISQITLPIIYLSEEDKSDTLIKEMLGITESRPKAITVEFWESPLNFSGYKLSRKKLVVYGLSPQHDYSFYRKKKDYYLSAQEVFYFMRETQEFKNYEEVSRQVVFND